MANDNWIDFDPFRLDVINECLWNGSRSTALRPKAFVLLTYLLDHPGQLLTKEELLRAVWPETFVGEAVLKVTIRQLREILGDDPKAPRFIETSHRRGYRFIGLVRESGQAPYGDREIALDETGSTARRADDDSSSGVVGREAPLARLRSGLRKMHGRERQILFVTGEPGIGKTTLVDTLLRSIASDGSIRIGRGQCLEQYGTGEAYLPVLEAIGRLSREHSHVVDVLRAHAPMWLLQMPALASDSEREALNRKVVGATRERMLREMAEALEVLTADEPLVLVLEDLHWSDDSTLDLISYLARQRHGAKLMVIGTYRPSELNVSAHALKALKRELLAKRQCEEVPLEYLDEAAILEYLTVRFPANRFPVELARTIHDRTEGNPLFMVNAIDYLAAAGVIVEAGGSWEVAVAIERLEVGVPDSIKQMIETQIDRLDPDLQRTLEAASVAGAVFSTPSVVAALDEPRSSVEERCDELAHRRQFLEPRGVDDLPNGEQVTRYAFVHSLYRTVLYERIPVARRVQLHRRIAEEGEAVYASRAGEIAAELAMHFERGANPKQAARYLQKAADNAMRRFAYPEAVGLSRHGLDLLERLPDSPQRAAQELCLQLTLGVPLIVTEGYAAPAVGSVYTRAHELCRELGGTPDVSEALWGLFTYHILRAELGAAREIAEEYLRLAERLPYPGLAMRGHLAMEIASMHMGQFVSALEHFEQALANYDPERHEDDALFYVLNPGVAMRCFAAWSLWSLGRPDEALRRIEEALSLARESSEPNGLAHALYFAATLHQFRRDARSAQECAEAAIAISDEHGLVLYRAIATIVRGWSLLSLGLHDEAIEQIRHGLEAQRATGTEVLRPHFLALLAEALETGGRAEEGLRVVDEAIESADRTGDGCCLAELHRVRGALFLTQATGRRRSRAATRGSAAVEPHPPEAVRAEGCFRRSIEIAQQQEAKSWELRATLSLARLYHGWGEPDRALGLLTRFSDTPVEGFDGADLREAKALADEVS